MKNKFKGKYRKIKNLVERIIEPSVRYIKNSRKRRSMPYKEIEALLRIYFPKTRYIKSKKGFFKHVYIIYSHKRKLVLKIGSKKKDIRKDHITYTRWPKNIRNRYFAKIYWRSGLFMLQKYGKETRIPPHTLQRLKDIGRQYNLKDVREANIMKFGNTFKIVDAERK